jgi:hypothetical protein
MNDFFKKVPPSLKDVEYWREHWQDMPEFIQEEKECYAKIIVRIDNEKDLQEFAKLINQKLSKDTKSIWHPKLERGKNLKRRWVAEEENK